MINLKTCFPLVLILISACTSQPEELGDDRNPVIVSLSELESQPVEERKMLESGLLKLSEVNISKEHNLFQPYLLNSVAGRIILFDSSPDELNFVVFDSVFTIRKRFGGFGRGPGEYLNIISLAVDEKNKSIFAVDDRNAKMETWTIKGELINSQEIANDNIYRLAAYKDTFIVHDSRNPANFIYLQNQQFSEKESIAEISSTIDHPVERFFVHAGNIVADTTSKTIYYSGWGNGSIKGFGLNGMEKFSYNSVEPIEHYFPIKGDNGRFNRDENKKPASRDLEIYNEYLVSLYTGKTKNSDQILDFYDKYSGIYEYSLKLDYKTIEVTGLSDKNIFYSLSLVDGDWIIVKYQLTV